MMHNLNVYCPYHTRGGLAKPRDQDEASGSDQPASKRLRVESECCDWQGSYTDLLAKHLSECPFHLIPCPHGCGESLRRKDVEGHAPTCASNYQDCPICREKVRMGQMDAHRSERAELHVRILEGKLSEKEVDGSDDMLSDVLKRVTELELFCKKLLLHMKARSDELKQCMKAQSDELKQRFS